MAHFLAITHTTIILFSIFLLIVSGHFAPNPDEKSAQTYIVRVQNSLKPPHYSNVVEWYSSTLKTLSSSNNNKILHVYTTVFHGFSAKLTREQAQELGQRPEILGLFPDSVRELHTTRSPEFLGLGAASDGGEGLLNETNYGSNVIIGLLDTGIWPERRSFHDDGLGPIPSRWRGDCAGGAHFPKSACNRKLIGVRYFLSGYEARFGGNTESARDTIGHGTHTASTAAGKRVGNASFLGYAPGVSSGIARKARLAMYRVCGEDGCFLSDIAAGIDAAVRDGVDVISVSLGGPPSPYDEDLFDIAAFRAVVKHGVVLSASAGNDGPTPGSVCNVAPWVITVGAGTIDRTFPAELVLGDGTVITGSSLYDGKAFETTTEYPLVYAGNRNASSGSNCCYSGELDPKLVKGKIVVCDACESTSVEKGVVVQEAGGVGVVVANVARIGEGLIASPFLTPGIEITYSARAKVLRYIADSVPPPRARLVFSGTHLGAKPAPVASFFTSRGPNRISPDILKPDLIAPGVNILAAWPDGIPPSDLPSDPRRTKFNILSGTSMSCPHVSGIAALIKGAHPKWTPAMIKSAMMTTAYTVDREGQPIMDETNYTITTPWDIGTGHVDPIKAVDPGLVYDLTAEDYVSFLCASNYTNRRIRTITGMNKVDCKEYVGSRTWDLNYPGIVVQYNVSSSGLSKGEISVRRRATHVSNDGANYSVEIISPVGVTVTVDPVEMVFSKKGETQSYKVTISANDEGPRGRSGSDFGRLTWKDGKHLVTSPLVISWVN